MTIKQKTVYISVDLVLTHVTLDTRHCLNMSVISVEGIQNTIGDSDVYVYMTLFRDVMHVSISSPCI